MNEAEWQTRKKRIVRACSSTAPSKVNYESFLAVSLVSFFAVTIFPLTDIRAAEFAVSTNSVVVLIGGKDARRALTTEDDFIRALSEFDKTARAKSEMPVSRARFLNFIEGEVAMWTDADVAKVERAATNARQKLSQFKLALPARILLVKTTGREEADSAYCRGTNVIVLSRQFVNGSAAELNSILIHELFHILSRNNPQLREKLYALIGFKPCAERLLWPAPFCFAKALASNHAVSPTRRTACRHASETGSSPRPQVARHMSSRCTLRASQELRRRDAGVNVLSS